MSDEKVTDAAEHMYKSAMEFQGHALQARQMCNKQYRAKESSDQNSLRISIDGLVASIATRLDKPINSVTAEASYQVGLSASFIRTYFLVTDMLLQGDMIEALVLVRKQIETLARLLELDNAPVKELEGKTPNIKHVLINGTGRIYGHLSEVAHFSTPNASEILGVNEDGYSLVPIFQDSQLAYMETAQFTGLRFASVDARQVC